MDKADLIVVQRERLLGGRQTTREVWLSSLIEWVIWGLCQICRSITGSRLLTQTRHIDNNKSNFHPTNVARSKIDYGLLDF